MRNIPALLLVAALTLTACGQQPQHSEPEVAQGDVKGAVTVLDLPYEATPKVDEAARISQEIAWRIIQNASDPNRLTSPSSLSMSLAQAAEGARTVTLESCVGGRG